MSELAELCGVTKRAAAWKYVKRLDFPSPLDHLAAGPVWRVSDIEAWATSTLPLASGRPKRKEGNDG